MLIREGTLGAGREGNHVRLDQPGGAPSCGACARRGNPDRFLYPIDASLVSAAGLRPGDAVRLVLPESRLIGLATLFYLLPLLSLLLAALAAQAAGLPEGGVICAAFAALGLGCLAPRLLLRGTRAADFLPTLHRASGPTRILLRQAPSQASSAAETTSPF